MKQKFVKMRHDDGRETEINITETDESQQTMKEHGFKTVGSPFEREEREAIHSSRVFNEEFKDYQVIHQTKDGKRTVVSGPNTTLPPAPPPDSRVANSPAGNQELSAEELEAKYSGMTKADLAELLDARGIKYGANETKAELIQHLTS